MIRNSQPILNPRFPNSASTRKRTQTMKAPKKWTVDAALRDAIMTEALSIATHMETQLSKLIAPLHEFLAPKPQPVSKTFTERVVHWVGEDILVPRSGMLLISFVCLLASLYHGYLLWESHGTIIMDRFARTYRTAHEGCINATKGGMQAAKDLGNAFKVRTDKEEDIHVTKFVVKKRKPFELTNEEDGWVSIGRVSKFWVLGKTFLEDVSGTPSAEQ